MIRKRRQKINNPGKFNNEFDSFKKKVGKHAVWFESLNSKKQWDLMFEWKKFKFKNKSTPISLSKFLFACKKTRRFSVSPQKLRDTTINKLFQI